MGISKDRISSPLEAGTSLLESQKLPLQVVEALDYVSERMIRKRLHLTLIVARNTPYQTPLRHGSPMSAFSSVGSPSPSPSTSVFSKAHWASRSGFSRAAASSPLTSSTNETLPSPSLPASPSVSADSYGVSLLHATTLSEKASLHLYATVTKACKKFRLGSEWLAPPVSPTDCQEGALPKDLIRRSLQQNDIVFGNEGLTLLSVDRLYTFKLALAAYSASSNQGVNEALTAAVNELRLLVLSHKCRRISAAYLYRSYADVAISESGLQTINAAYRSVYQSDAIALHPSSAKKFNAGDRRPITDRADTEDVAVDLKEEQTEVLRLSHWLGRRAGGGPNTPKGYEDVTPITRCEWGFLMGQREGGNMGAVETC